MPKHGDKKIEKKERRRELNQEEKDTKAGEGKIEKNEEKRGEKYGAS